MDLHWFTGELPSEDDGGEESVANIVDIRQFERSARKLLNSPQVEGVVDDKHSFRVQALTCIRV